VRLPSFITNRTKGIPEGTQISDPRDEYIRSCERQDFADLGGLWGVTGEKVSVVHRYGATALTMGDIGNDWKAFEERCRSLGIPAVQCIKQDILTLADEPNHPIYDVTHCSGVLYHLPNPMRLLEVLHKITRRHVILTSCVTQTEIRSDRGSLHVPDGGALFIPALKNKELSIVRSYWANFLGPDNIAIGITKPVEATHHKYDPWWWLFTVNTLKSMCSAAGFETVAGSYY